MTKIRDTVRDFHSQNPDVLYLGVITAAIAVYFGSIFLSGKFFFIGDIYTQFYPWKEFFHRAMQGGTAPFWNPTVFSGVPFAADIQKGVFYPLGIIFAFMDFPSAYKIYILAHFLIMGYSAYMLLKKLGFSPAPATAGVIVFLFNSFTVSKINFVSALGSYAFIPALILTLMNYLESSRLHFLALFALLFSLSILAGHPPTVVYASMLMLAFAVYQLTIQRSPGGVKSALKSTAFILCALLCALIITLPQTGLFFELLGLSSRGAPFEYNMAAETSMPFMNMWTFLMPGGLNGFSTNFLNDWFYYSMGMMNFFSITALFLLLLSFFYPKNRLYKFSVLMTLLSVVMALGRYTPVHSWFFTFFPFFSQLRHPGFAMTLFTLPFSIIAAFTVEHIISMTPAHVPFLSRFAYTSDFSKKVYRIFIYIMASLVATILLIILNRDPFVKTYSLTPRVALNFVMGLFLFSAILGANFLLFYAREKGLIRGGFYVFTLLSALFMEFIFFIAGVNPLIDQSIYHDFKPSTLQLLQGTNYKLLHTDELSANRLSPGPTLYEAEKSFLSSIPSNTGTLYNLNDAGGYNPVEPRQYSSFLKSAVGPGNTIDHAKLNLLNVKYLISRSEITDPGLDKVYDGPIKIYKNIKALPVFFTTKDRDNVDLIVGQYSWSRKKEFDYTYYDVEATMEKDGYFVFSNNLYPGWRVYVDNIACPIEKCFGIYMCVKVSAGYHRVVFQYLPVNFKWYLAAFFLAAAAFLYFAAVRLVPAAKKGSDF
jgi:hypothetical protein